MKKPEEEARETIDAAFEAAGWNLQDAPRANVHAARGVAIREFPLKPGHGFADYLLYVDGKAAGVVEAKAVGATLTGVELQTRKYSEGMPPHLPRAWDPLPFLYQSTGVETRFTDRLDPDPRSRPVFHFHQPETLADWLKPADDLPSGHPLAGRPANLRALLQHLPELASERLWDVQRRAVVNLERSLRENRPRALIQMATGSGKTFTAITSAYRLIKFGGARRVLFLVDRSNLGRQALKEFQQYVTPDDGRKLSELYNIQHLTSNKLDPVARVTISTIQRLYSMLKGEEPVPGLEDSPVPKGYDWPSLLARDGDALEVHYRQLLEEFGKKQGMLGIIFRKAQNKIQDPAKLRRLIADLIDREQWSSLDADVKGDAYEGLLEKNAQDTKGGAGQYFTPRPVIQAIVDVIRPQPRETICDPACGTGGFLLAAHDYIARHNPNLDRTEKRHLKLKALRGYEIVDSVTRLCAMNLLLHGIGPGVTDNAEPPVETRDSLASHPGCYFNVVLTNPPFGRKSSVLVVNEEGDQERQALTVVREDFWATTTNKQLNFVQHVLNVLEIHGRAAVVVPDNVLFEGGAGETIRKNLLHDCDVHTLLRLPPGIWYAQGVKANVLFFDRKPAAEKPWTKKLWIYDLRTNKHFTLKTNTLKRSDLDELVACYNPENRHKRKATWSEKNPDGRWRAYSYEELIQRDKHNLDIFWLKDESLEASENLPDPDVIAAEIVEDLRAALEQFEAVLADLPTTAADEPAA